MTKRSVSKKKELISIECLDYVKHMIIRIINTDLGQKYLGEKEKIISPPPDTTHTPINSIPPCPYLKWCGVQTRHNLLSPYSTKI